MPEPTLNLLKRPPGYGFVSARSLGPGEPIRSELKLGAQVTLRTEEVEIIARITAFAGDRVTGEIEDFVDHGPTYSGYHIGDQLTFGESNVFVCTY